MSIFTEVKERITAREVAEFYGLKVGKKGLACCPFHNVLFSKLEAPTPCSLYGLESIA
ncbi:MAG: hypothetical protein PHY47_25880 [Lachnospiraceae bacterium]|nr:hypothetical protein [Lachnospiraceae bacterium]